MAQPTSSRLKTVQDASPDAKDPMSDPAAKQQVEDARGVIFHLLKSLKTIQFYRHAESKFPEFLAKSLEALTAYTEKYKVLQLKVELTNLTMHKQDLFNDDSPLPYRFFKDGIRQLMFRHGFTLEELITFSLIAISDPDRGDEDINTQLWRAQMPHFEYIMVEGFRMDEFSEEEIQVEVDKVVDLLQQRLRSNSADYLRFARITAEDLEAKLNDVDQVRGLVVSGVTADAGLKARVQKDVDEEENQRLFPKLISAVFQVVESGVDDPQLLTDMFAQLLDAMLLQEDFIIINQVVLKLRAMTQRQGEGSAVGTLLQNFIVKMGEEQRLSRVGDVLRYGKLKAPQEIVKYLSTLNQDTTSVLLDVLNTLEVNESRTLLCDVLVPRAKHDPDTFAARLNFADKPQTQRDLVYIIDRANHPEKLRFFSSLLKSKNLALRLDVMGIIARGRSGEARKLIAQMLEDENAQIRLHAARILPEFDREKAYHDLMTYIRTEVFEKRSADERQAIYAAIGSTGLPAATNFFSGLLKTKAGLFNKQKVIDDKLLALAGIAASGTIQAAKFLQDIVDDSSQQTEVHNHAKAHLARVKKSLFGAEGATPRG